jgi:hypothetical protein
MSTICKVITSVVLVAQLAACAGRDAAMQMPVATPGDQALNCEALYAEIVGNNAKVSSLQSEESSKRGQNIAMGVVGAIIFWPALFAMDFKDAAGTDRKAVEARLAYLNTLYAGKACTNSMGAVPSVPAPVPAAAPEPKPAVL